MKKLNIGTVIEIKQAKQLLWNKGEIMLLDKNEIDPIPFLLPLSLTIEDIIPNRYEFGRNTYIMRPQQQKHKLIRISAEYVVEGIKEKRIIIKSESKQLELF